MRMAHEMEDSRACLNPILRTVCPYRARRASTDATPALLRFYNLITFYTLFGLQF